VVIQKLQEALEAYQQSLKIRQTLAEQDKTNSGWQRDLSVNYEKIGDVLLAQGNLQEALEAYQQDLAIAKALAEQDPTNAVWQNGTAWSRYCVAKVLIRIKDGDRNEARRLMLIRLFQQTTSCSVRSASSDVSENLARISVAVL
jgi:tetratricopeptide (TPR) repeat protein